MTCTKCGQENDLDAVFCENCGAKFEQPQEETQNTTKKPAPRKPRNKVEFKTLFKNVKRRVFAKVQLPTISRKALAIGAGCLAVAVIACAMLFSPKHDPVIYVRDGQLMMMDGSGSVLIHDEFSKGKAGEDRNAPDVLASLAQLSSDGEYLYYLTDYEDGYALYSVKLSRVGKEEPTKISSSVSSITVPQKDNGIYYIKNYDGTTGKLYRYDHTANTMIAKNVPEDCIAASGNFVLYLKQNPESYEKSLYLYNIKKEAETKLDTNISEVYHAKLSRKPSEILYSKAGESGRLESVYITAYEEEKQKLVSNGEILGAATDAIFYTVEDEGNSVLYRFDFSEAGPERICDNTGSCALLDASVLSYYDRDDKTNYILTGSGLCLESMDTCYGAAMSKDGTQLLLLENSDAPRSEQYGFTATVYSLKDGNVTEQTVVSEDTCADCYYDREKKAVYYFVDVDSKNNGSLYRYQKQEAVRIADDVNTKTLRIDPVTSNVVYFSDCTDETGALNVFDKKTSERIDTDVSITNWGFAETDKVLYLKNWDAANGGEFYIYNGSKTKRIASDVQSFVCTGPSETANLVEIAAQNE